jgi:hypothetical protein
MVLKLILKLKRTRLYIIVSVLKKNQKYSCMLFSSAMRRMFINA